MAAIVDIVIRKSPSEVWAVIADASTHIHWLGSDSITTYEGDRGLTEGMKFTRFNKRSGQKVEGEIVAVKPAQFLKVRVDGPENIFATTEYHLLSVAEGCALRMAYQVYETGEKRHGYFPDAFETQWRANLERLKQYCEKETATSVGFQWPWKRR
jgi:uncharacterized protein YndB with AHSA1/START domain